MNIYHLKYIVETVKYDFNLTKTAENLFITQSALSKTILAIEEQLGNNIFARKKGRIIALTAIGEIIYKYALQILQLENEMQAEIKAAQLGSQSIVRLGIVYAFMKFIFGDIKHLLMAEYNNIALEIQEANYFEVTDKFKNNLIDLLITLRSPYTAEVIYEELLQCEYVCICDKNHPFSKLPKLKYSDLNKQILVVPSELNYSKFLIDEKLKIEHVKPKKYIYMLDPSSLLDSIMGTTAICILPSIFLENTSNMALECKKFYDPLRWHMDLVMYKKDLNNSAITSTFREVANAIKFNGMGIQH